MTTTEDLAFERIAASADRAHLRVLIPPNLRYFEGHFEHEPMLPGVAELIALVQRPARQLFGPLGREARIVRAKFESVIRPRDVLDVHLERTPGPAEGEIALRYRIERGGTVCASGAIVHERSRTRAPTSAAAESVATGPDEVEGSRLERVMPHRAPMLLLDRMIACTDTEAVCVKTFRDGDVFVEDGAVSALVAIELFAQGAAAHFGYLATARGTGFASGALLGSRKLELDVDRYRVGERLDVRVLQVMSMPPAAQYDCRLERAGRVIARGAISVALGTGLEER